MIQNGLHCDITIKYPNTGRILNSTKDAPLHTKGFNFTLKISVETWHARRVEENKDPTKWQSCPIRRSDRDLPKQVCMVVHYYTPRGESLLECLWAPPGFRMSVRKMRYLSDSCSTAGGHMMGKDKFLLLVYKKK